MWKIRFLFTTVLISLTSSTKLGQDRSLETNEIENSSYNFEYKVADEEEQVYQQHQQTMDNQVVTGEYSWVDPEGTLHLVRYRADETGYHILESINQRGFVKIVPKPPRSSRKLLRKVRVLKSSLGSHIRSNGLSPAPLRRKLRVLRPASSRTIQQVAPAPEPFLAAPPPREQDLVPQAEFDLTA